MTKWKWKKNYMGNVVLWERMLGDFGDDMAFEMYAVQKDAFTGVYYVGGGTFKLTDYPAEERNFQLRQHHIDTTDTSFENVMKLAEALFTANFADFDLESTKDRTRAEFYADHLVQRDFVSLFNGYVTLGYSFIEFCRPCEGGFVMAFDLEDNKLEDLPKEAFDIPEVNKLMKGRRWNLYDPDVLITDLSDDVTDIIDGYDWDANYPVMHLNDKWHSHEGYDKKYTMEFTLGTLRMLRPGHTMAQYEDVATMLINNWKEGMEDEIDGILFDAGLQEV